MANYPDFIESTGYGDVAGLCGANCRHSFGPYHESSSLETYSEAVLEEMSAKTVTYTDWLNGEKMTVPYYDGTQLQRKLERRVRELDRAVKLKTAAGVDASIEKSKLKVWRRRVKNFTEETGLRRDYSRERTRKI